MIPRHLLVPLAGIASAAACLLALGGCDRKPAAPGMPTTSGAVSGPTAASGGPPSNSYPAGIKPAPSGDQVPTASVHDGPAKGATAIGGVSAGQSAGAPAGANAGAPTGGDGKPPP